MQRIPILAVLAVGAASLVSCGNDDALAGTAVRLDLDELVERSSLVFEGRVLERRAVRSADGRIETELRLAADRHFVGAETPERVVRVPGGVLPDGSGLLIPGMPRVAEGEELILFLTEPSATGSRMPVGLGQGKLRVVTDLSGARVLVREPVGLSTALPNAPHAHQEGWEVMGYAETIAHLRAAADRKGAAAGGFPAEDKGTAAGVDRSTESPR